MSKSARVYILLGFAAALATAVLLQGAILQDQEYHQFADQRTVLGVPHFFNATSNLFFVIVGLLGLRFVFPRPPVGSPDYFLEPSERAPWIFFYAGITLAGFGSAYYHLAPGDERLFWDRLPIAIAAMALLSAVIVQRISPRVGLRLLLPLTLVGVGSVWYWSAVDDLRLYAYVQMLPLVLVPLILLLFPPRYTRGTDFLVAIGLYVFAKIFELLDERIYAMGGVISGHSLKHVAAAGAALVLLVMLKKRRSTAFSRKGIR